MPASVVDPVLSSSSSSASSVRHGVSLARGTNDGGGLGFRRGERATAGSRRDRSPPRGGNLRRGGRHNDSRSNLRVDISSCAPRGGIINAVWALVDELYTRFMEFAFATPGVTWSLASTFAKAVAASVRSCDEWPLAKKFEGRPMYEALVLVTVAVVMGIFYFAYLFAYVPLANPDSCAVMPKVFQVCFLFAMVSYHEGVVTDPGGVPEDWSDGPGVSDRIFLLTSERKRSTGALRFCNKENKYKPDRAHFCSQLDKNVLRMDHYCPWLANCVGLRNHKFFFLFLLYTVIVDLILFFSLSWALLVDTYPVGFTAFMFGCAVLASLLAFLLTPFLGFHTWLLAKNITTIEFCERMAAGDTEGWHSAYDVGVFENMRSVLGDSIVTWFIPIQLSVADGIVWRRSEPVTCEA
eukprot:TRINITY_DN76020_c0_g1_i1.p1 TRINITY_DN76020_c0_g1~~TRINITY_DN76020_c0_g1_i1.p1  ORF type:complete len:481 (-),score=61.81 TRINITY_DN76020_c0_g1_i1:30-1256(-)